MSMITTVEEALMVAKNGTDIIVAQGSEAGGHRIYLQCRCRKRLASNWNHGSGSISCGCFEKGRKRRRITCNSSSEE